MKTNQKGFWAIVSAPIISSVVARFSFLLLSCLLWGNVGWGQVTVTNPSNTTPALSNTYTSLALAITAVNNTTAISGPVTITLTAAQTAPAGGYSITAIPTGASSTNKIIFDGGGNTITAGVGTSTTNDAIFKLIGADFITLQNFVMVESAANTTVATQIEWGVALLYATTTNGAQNITIQNNTITLNRTNANSIGIYSNSTHTATAVGSSATATTAAGSNSGMIVYSNTINNVNQGIIVVGPTAVADANTGIDIGGSSSATANTISNFGTTTTSSYINVSVTINGILVRNCLGFNISFNNITSSNGGVILGTLNGIQIQASTFAPTATFTNNINSNTIALTTGISGTINGITYPSGSASATSVLNVNSNNFTAATSTVTNSGTIVLISVASANLTTSISNNTFTNIISNTTGSFTFISHGYTMPASATQTISGNSIVTAFSKTGAGGTVTIATSPSSSPNGTSHTFTNNNFSNITVTGATGITGVSNTDGASSSATRIVTGNTFNNWTGGTSTILGLSYSYIGGATSSFSSNTLTNITGQGAITGINLGSTANLATTVNVASNTINNLSSTGTGGQVLAISCSNTSTTININGNTINNLSSSAASSAVGAISVFGATTTNVYQNVIYNISTSGATAPLALGIQVAGGTLVNVYRNKIYNLSASGGTLTSLNSAVSGIYLNGGTTVNTYNNLIGNLTAPNINLADAIRGISITYTTASTSQNVYNNTVYITGGSVGANFGTSGIYHTASATATTAALDLQNNMIFNTCTPSGTGIVAAYRRSSGVASMLANYASASNKNLFYAGTPGASNLIYSDGTSSAQTMAAYQAGVFTAGTVATRDANSFTESAFTPSTYFVSTSGSNANYLQPASGLSTQAEGGGNTITICSPDYNGVTRPGFSGAAYDVGAWEFAGVSPAPVLTNMTPSPALTAQCTKAARAISIDITTTSGTITGVTLNYSHNGSVQTAVTMTNSSGNTWTGTMLAPSTGNASVTWSITATNSSGLSSSYTGATYSDEPNTGVTASATASPSSVCAGSNASLSMSVYNTLLPLPTSSSPTYSLPPAITYPTTDEDFGNITISNGSTTILNNTSSINSLVGTIGTATGTAGSYSNFTSFGPYNLVGGSTYNLSISSLQSSTAYSNYMAVYIDYNRNGVFSDAGEQVYISDALGSGAHTKISTFLVPTTALNGLMRMRVYDLESLSVVAGSVVTGSYGEYEEYSINLTGGTPGQSVTPSAYSWSNGSSTLGTTNPLTTAITSGLTYTATATVNGCPMTASVTPTVNPLPTAPTATPSSQCGSGVPSASVADNNSYTTPIFKWYSASSGGTLLQSSTSTTYTTSISNTTTFYVAVVNPTTSCESARTAVVVTVTQPDAISATTSAAAICLGQSITLTAANTATTPTQNYSYSWACATSGSGATSANTNNPASITPSAAGSYTYTVTGTDGACSAVNTVAVTVNALPTSVTASSNSSTICLGSSVNLTSLSSSSSLLDASGDGGFETGATFPLNNWTVVNGTYNIWSVGSFAGVQSGTNAALIGTANVATANVSINHFYRDVVIPVGSTNINLSFYLKMAIVDNTYDYLNVYTTSTSYTPVAGILPSTGYTSVFSNTATVYSTYSLQNITLPNTLAGTTVRLVFTYKCDGYLPYSAPAVDYISLSFIPTSNYSWTSNPSGFTSALQNPTGVSPTVTTTYTATSTNAAGCTSSNTATVTVTPTNTASAASATPTLCINTALTSITHTTTGATGIGTASGLPTGVSAAFASNTITISGTPTASGTFNYSIPLTGGCGSVNATGSITVNALPTTSVLTGTLACAGSTGTISSSTSQSGVNYQLYDASNTAVGSAIAGTGSSLTWSSLPIANGYYVIGTNATSSCVSANSNAVAVGTITNKTWTGATNNDWSTASNWSCGSLPTSSDVIIINTSNPAPVMGVDFTVGATGSLTIGGTGALVISPSKTLTIAGAVNFGGKSVTLKSDSVGTARIATITGTLTNATNVTQERFVPGKAIRKWSFLASPVTQSLASAWQQQIHITGAGTGGTMCNNYTISGSMTPHSNGFDVTQLQNPSFYTYDAATDNFVANTTGTTNYTLTPGDGYMVLVRGDRNDATNGGCVLLSANNQAAFTSTSVTLAATGAVGQGTIIKVLPAGYSFIGNPYPCEIDFPSFNTTNTSVISGGYWTYYPTNATYTFSTYNNGTSTNGGTQVLANGQSFLVNSTSGGTITFNEAHKSTTANNGNFRLTKTWDELIRVGLSNNQGTRFDEVVVRFANDAAITKALNEYDAASVNGGDQWIKTLKETSELAIQTRPNTYQNDTVSLAMHAKNAGTYQLGFSEYQGLSNTEVYLIDQQENLIQNVKALPNYEFSVGANTTTANRFKLIFEAKTSGVAALATKATLQVYPNPTKDKVRITCSGLEYGAYQIKVRTITGAEVLKAKGTYYQNEVIELSLQDLAAGMYMLELTQDNGFRAIQKITKQ